MRFFIKSFLALLCISMLANIHAQNTVGLISYNQNKAYDGYNLIYQHNQPNVYLLNNCGEIVHSWKGEPDTRPGNTAYLLDDGRLVKTLRPAMVAGNPIWAGGGGATVEIRSWDNELEWSFTLNNENARLHHDIAIIEKNGKMTIAMIAWEKKNLEEVIAAGRDTSVLERDEMWPDYILEVDPETDEIVWEWHAWDHLVQAFDSSKDNFGVVSENPGRIDVNLDFDGTGDPDWMHSNSLDYDPRWDYLMLSVPYFSEIWIIDHTTSTEQAAGNSGGFSGVGGDLMYRWGNPQIYNQGDSTDQTLFFQHDANFIDDFIPGFDPNFGKIAIFNNRIGADFSAGTILNSQFDMYDWSFPFDGNVFGPEEAEQTFYHPVEPQRMYSTGLSGFQYLPNGNYLFTSGRFGYTFEMTPSNEIVWEYITPQKGTAPVEQGDTTLTMNSNLTFRVKRYPSDYSAFDGRDLSRKGWIELNPDTTYCDQLTSTGFYADHKLDLYPNPANDMITVEWEAGRFISLEVVDASGRRVDYYQRLSGGRKYLDTSGWIPGLYVIRINNQLAGKFLVHH